MATGYRFATMNAEELLAVVSNDLTKSREWRDQLIVDMRNDGATFRKIADLTGLTPAGIAKIVGRNVPDSVDNSVDVGTIES